ncbi:MULTISPECIES: NAD(P)H-hydrate dehydratase [Halocynthiibacter]|uniref:Bifunctional NAD(P)H-hydrate repair enzyme n=1 Tax=Halocynthiibacter halioticoli TaxID=2986804 RepID=A0AAE3IXI0_9RHOB|nr:MULTISPECIES: NAD(P)H-hydrate dehydratase [Halocynthiibacter]MCV6824062.1 NAD(P)H-hydrate dehydratase [Halocynthiibacter halioticoli]MCW4057063.1 NAD(P)H-hydrate dehydratase [Halocynthiibacter sp. SDUM655004]
MSRTTIYMTAAEMRALEIRAMESGAVTGADLMERAGRGVVDATFARWPALAKTRHRAVVLCGPGNNGGDGYVIARLLHHAGWGVRVLSLGDTKSLPADAKLNAQRWSALDQDSAATAPLNAETLADALGEGCDLVVDALFGSGLNRPVSGLAYIEGSISALEARPIVVAVDVPSGLSSDTGTCLGEPVAPLRADLTVTFHSPFVGHVLVDGPEVCGALEVVDIGLARFAEPVDVRAQTPNPSGLAKHPNAHKFTHGHALVFSGGAGKTGAARLAARGALRIGAGLVTLGCPPDALAECAAQVTAIMLRPLNDTEALRQTLDDTRINALCLGPNFGLSPDRADWLMDVLATKRAAVLDADALTLLARHEKPFSKLHEQIVLTPHMGEFKRLFPEISAELTENKLYSKLDATRDAAKTAGCTVLLKGAATVIANAQGDCRIVASCYENAAPWLATAGAGDVLAGMITGLLARGFAPIEAAESAAHLHAECARRFGPGLIAEDLPEQLPAVLAELESASKRSS